MPWRREPGPGQDQQELELLTAIGLIAAGLALLLATAVMGGCAAPQVECTLGSFSRTNREVRSASGAGTASAAVLTQTGAGRGEYRTAGSAAVACERVCQPGQCLRASEDSKGFRSIECYPCDGVRQPPSPPKVPTS
jgi:hypothetical protein